MPLGRMLLAATLLVVEAAASTQVRAEGSFYGWRRNHYGSRFNYRTERIHALPRSGPHMPYRPRSAQPR